MDVRVFLSTDFRATCMGWDNSVDYGPPIQLDIDSTGDPMADCEVVYAICNSHEGELHCDSKYADQVELYRVNRTRSLSVGDLVAIGEATFAVAGCGFELAVGFVDTFDYES